MQYNNISKQKSICMWALYGRCFVCFLDTKLSFLRRSRKHIVFLLFCFFCFFVFFLVYVLFLLSQAEHLVSLFTSILQWMKRSTSFLLAWNLENFRPFGSTGVFLLKNVQTCSTVVGFKVRGRMNKINVFCFHVCP